MQLLFAYFPIVLLVFLMTKKNSMPSYRALPLTALTLYFIALVVFKYQPNHVHANILHGLLLAWTPILIIAGAIFLFRTMEVTGALATIKTWLNTITQNRVAQLMIVGWAFPFLIEGASGFGTPAAIAAPILVGLGFPPVRAAILVLIMNSIPVSFGAVGTPTWFGFNGISLSEYETLLIGLKSAIMNGVAALFIPAIALMFVVKPKSVMQNILFILLSVLATVIPYIAIARFNYEFPSLIGGFIGLILTVILAKKGIGLSKNPIELREQVGNSALVNEQQTESNTVSTGKLLKASFPLWGTILLLVFTRIPQIGLKNLLTAGAPELNLSLGSLGEFGITPALVISLKNIFLTGINWSHSLLYVPSIIPFVLISVVSFWWNKTRISNQKLVLASTIKQMQKPSLALLGALVFVNLMMMGQNNSAVTQIGRHLADLTGSSWKYFASYLGALGSFFSGSNTISNLTFGGIQDSIAASLNLNRTTILAMQSVGGAMGNMVCINNIVAVASVLALGNKEGFILKKTVIAMLVYGVIVALTAMFF